MITNLDELKITEKPEDSAKTVEPTPEEEIVDEEEVLDDQDEGIEDEDDDDDEGWITPSNIKAKKQEFNGENEQDGQKPVKVACMTTDFAMQVIFHFMVISRFLAIPTISQMSLLMD